MDHSFLYEAAAIAAVGGKLKFNENVNFIIDRMMHRKERGLGNGKWKW
jgi:hypothetical protein